MKQYRNDPMTLGILSRVIVAFTIVISLVVPVSGQEMTELETQHYETRAVETAIWGIPIVDLWSMRDRKTP